MLDKIIDALVLANSTILWAMSAAGAGFWLALYYPILRKNPA